MIVQSYPVLIIPTEPNDLALLLYAYSTDWEQDLNFLRLFALAKGMDIEVKKIKQLMENLNGRN